MYSSAIAVLELGIDSEGLVVESGTDCEEPFMEAFEMLEKAWNQGFRDWKQRVE